MTSPADLSSKFNGEIRHDLSILVTEWQQEIDAITIDMAEIVKACTTKPVKSHHFCAACFIAAYTGPIVACGGIKVLLYPLLLALEKRFPEEHVHWIYYLMTKEIMRILWQQPVKRKLLESAVYEDDEGAEDDDGENESRLDEMLAEAIPKGTLEWLLLGVDIRKSETSEK